MTHQQIAEGYSDRALFQIAEFFRNYRPETSRDREWMEEREPAVKAEIQRRINEDKEAML
jgi:hypothetical protein